MKRFKNWIHGSLWAVHFRPGALCSGEGCVDRRRGQKFDKENSTALAPVFTLAPVKGTENQSWLSLLTKKSFRF